MKNPKSLPNFAVEFIFKSFTIMEQKQKITEHFTLNEMTHSAALLKYNKEHKTNYQNLPNRTGIEMNLHHLCMQLEQIRARMDWPLVISSGYRSSLVNELVQGAKFSLHTQGLAADVLLPLDKICEFVTIAMDMEFTKEVLISHKTHSGSTWVHYGCTSRPKDQCRVGIDFNGQINTIIHTKFINKKLPL